MYSSLQKSKTARYVLLFTVNVAILVGMLALLEFASRFTLAKLGVVKRQGNTVDNYYLNHTWRPNTSQVHREWRRANPDFPNPYTHYYNDKGWLETYDVAKVKPPGTYRVFYLGDSFTEGTVPMDQSVPSVVEKGLNAMAAGSGLSFEVVNTGTTSYSPILYYLLTRHELVDYSPDLIVVNVDMTDDFDDWKYRGTLIIDDKGDPFAAPPRNVGASNYLDLLRGTVKMTFWRRAQLFLYQHSNTFNLVLEVRRRLFPSGKAADAVPSETPAGEFYQRWLWCRDEWDESTRKQVAFTLSVLQKLADLCRSRNIKIAFTTVPHHAQYVGNEDGAGPPAWSARPHYEIARFAKSIGVPCLNAYEELKPLVQGTPHSKYYYVGDMHFNPRGYAIWSESHLRFLVEEKNGLLPERFYRAQNGRS